MKIILLCIHASQGAVSIQRWTSASFLASAIAIAQAEALSVLLERSCSIHERSASLPNVAVTVDLLECLVIAATPTLFYKGSNRSTGLAFA